MADWLSVTDVEKVTGIPNASIRRYIRNHGRHLIFKKDQKDYFIASESVKMMEIIYLFYANGMDTEQVEESLEEMTIPKAEGENGPTSKELIEKIYEQSLLNQRQQQALDEKLKKRDEKLTAVLRRKTAMNEKPSFFKRLFNKS
ncbi:hypothetical protein JOD45_001815 [Scopulibacillus daqui]|uniref:MerR-like DNA binding protein n=1 Tax=Scopulibacillus daqui TaxID=1469162 RepID=A0ABS2PZX4_9BACL|nr:hypothetical protein [Scopulibacillus daqui]MBM7645597.1 hypothetical protein [Scopulibacillus daqui]